MCCMEYQQKVFNAYGNKSKISTEKLNKSLTFYSEKIKTENKEIDSHLKK